MGPARRIDVDRAGLEKARRQSMRALPVYAALTAGAACLVYALPRWWSWTILIMTAFTLVGDLVNLWHAGRRLALSSPQREG